MRSKAISENLTKFYGSIVNGIQVFCLVAGGFSLAGFIQGGSQLLCGDFFTPIISR
ncbi:hypothetical protein B6N60_04418 [Richelia sinica FACHB-800]|uniref:Uncharacterized protein n=1 Tax=Richelia sinica FACHB-800 TaxID=1357546 RepID=A0A975TBE3_9NOST|nr:hypothetical protein B6N60_04418 [Richelia sinica FACHB-800]